MEICNVHPEQIVYDEKLCPLCQCWEALQAAEDEIHELREEKEKLEGEVEDIKEKYRIPHY